MYIFLVGIETIMYIIMIILQKIRNTRQKIIKFKTDDIINELATR